MKAVPVNNLEVDLMTNTRAVPAVVHCEQSAERAARWLGWWRALLIPTLLVVVEG